MRKKELVFAFKHTYPMLISWIPVALAYGLMMRNAGYNALWTGICGVFMVCGSLQMVAVSFFTSAVSWIAIALTAAAVAFRHLFYGLSFLERFRRFGAAKWYMIYMLCDELYSVFCAFEIPPEMNEKRVHLLTTFLLEFYWIALSMLGTAVGAVIPIDLTGIDFALTALFVVILIDMLRKNTTALPCIAAVVCTVLCLVCFGASSFLIPALLLTVAVLLVLRRRMDPAGKEVSADGG